MTVEIVAGRKTGLRRAGVGAPALLLHCSLAHSGAWSGVMAALQDRLGMLAVDLPGHGKTAFDPSLEVQAQAVETAVALLERNTAPAHLVGHSFGATVALRVALERPDLVASLSLYEPVYFSLLNGEEALAEAEASRPFADAAQAGDWPRAAEAFLHRWGGGQVFASLPKEAQAFILAVLPFLVAPDNPIIDPSAGTRILAGLPDLKVATLLMEGGQSPQVVSAINDVLAAHLSDTRRQVFPAAAHMGPITHAHEVADAIRAFLSGDDL